MWNDVYFAMRLIRSRPGFSALVILTFALGIGLNTALFTVVNSLLLRSLPGYQTDRLGTLFEQKRNGDPDNPNGETVRAWRTQMKSFEQIEASVQEPMNLTNVGPAEVVTASPVTAGWFHVFRASAILGRTFLPNEDKPGNSQVAVLDYDYWKRKFGGDTKVVGRTLLLDNQSYQVVGVMAEDFHPSGTHLVNIYLPLVMEELPAWGFHMIARLRWGVNLESARAEISAIAHAAQSSNPDKKGIEIGVMRLRDAAQREIRTGLLTLFTAVVLVLLIACANIANLLLARSSFRTSEFAVRLALGAGRLRLARQLITEGLLFAALGGALGAVLASWAMSLIVASKPNLIPRLEEVHIDGTVWAFSAALALIAGLLAALGPAISVMRHDLRQSLQGSGSRSTTSQHRPARVLVVAELMATFVLLAASALALQSFRHLTRTDPGYKPQNLLTFFVSVPVPAGSGGRSALALFKRITSRLEKLHGVRSAALTSSLPIGGITMMLPVRVLGRAQETSKPEAYTMVVSSEYFRTIGIPLHRGRFFTPRDRDGSLAAVVINESLARRFFPGENPIGQKLLVHMFDPNLTSMGKLSEREIVGVAGDVMHDEPRSAAQFEIYLPLDQNPLSFACVAVRTASDPAALAAIVQKEVAEEQRDLPVSDIKPMDARIQETLSNPRNAATLFSGFALLAITLAILGIYGVLSYAVALRTREIGVRIALGASPNGILALILKESLKLAAGGMALGIIAVAAMSRFVEAQLFGIHATDPSTLTLVSLALVALALAASAIPARIASRVDPMVALRSE
jgi:putative ABC transport system permease protein